MELDAPAQPQIDSIKAASAAMGVMSPVSQNGCFEFDRIIKAGNVVKRTRKTRVSTMYAGSTQGLLLTAAVLEARLHCPAPQLPLHIQRQE